MSPIEHEWLIGDAGDIDVKLENGVASVSFKFKEAKTGLKISIGLEIDASADLILIRDALDKKFPGGKIIIDAVFAILEKVLKGA
jgi:hypothetical protein